MRRVLTKTSVVRCSSISSARRSIDLLSRPRPTSPLRAASRAPRSLRSRGALMAGVDDRDFRRRPRRPRAAPTRKCATASIGFCVAERPIRSSRSPHSAASRSSDSARCAPRLFGATAWISSTITVRVGRQHLRGRIPSRAGRRAIPASSPGCAAAGGASRSRSAGGRVAGAHPGADLDIRQARCACSRSRMPASGASRLRWMSFDSALSGET